MQIVGLSHICLFIVATITRESEALTSESQFRQLTMASEAHRERASRMLDFLDTIGQLKRLERTGWVRSKIYHPESVADHMYRMSVMSACIEGEEIDMNHCTLMAIAHDMGEAIAGDITPHCKVSDADKYAKEEAAMKHICHRLLGGNEFGQKFFNLWKEYEEQNTLESQLVKQFDKLEMIIQAYEYERDQGPPGRLDDFFQSTVGKEGTFRHPQVIAMVEELVRRRQDLSQEKASS